MSEATAVGTQQVGMAIAVNTEHRLILMIFDHPIPQLPMPPDAARSIAKRLNELADQLDPPMVIVPPLGYAGI